MHQSFKAPCTSNLAEEEEDSFEDDDEEEDDTTGDESDIEDNVEVPHPCLNAQRVDNPQLPETVTTLRTPEGSVVYVVGTAHFSESSQQDVTQVRTTCRVDLLGYEFQNIPFCIFNGIFTSGNFTVALLCMLFLTKFVF